MQGTRESSSLRPFRSYSASTLPRASFRPISRRVCSFWQTRTTGETRSRTNSTSTSRTGCMIRLHRIWRTSKSRSSSRMEYAMNSWLILEQRRTRSKAECVSTWSRERNQGKLNPKTSEWCTFSSILACRPRSVLSLASIPNSWLALWLSSRQLSRRSLRPMLKDLPAGN